MKKNFLLLAFVFILGIIVSSCSSLKMENVIMKINKGMSKEEVVKLLGKPTYRRFDNQFEEWEYQTLYGNSILLVEFQDELVCGFDSFMKNNLSYDNVGAIAPSFIPNIAADGHRDYKKIMSENDFNIFYSKVKEKTFKDDQFQIMSVGVLNGYFSCNQCLRMMSIYTFDDDRFKVLELFAPRIVDRENSLNIIDSFSFISTKDKASMLLRGRRK